LFNNTCRPTGTAIPTKNRSCALVRLLKSESSRRICSVCCRCPSNTVYTKVVQGHRCWYPQKGRQQYLLW